MLGEDAYAYTSCGGRRENQDSYRLVRSGENLCAALADGLGGHSGGKQAAVIAVSRLSECGAQGNMPGQDEIMSCVEKANREILDTRGGSSRMKTTAVYLCIHGEAAVWAHIGDSRLYHFRDGILCDWTLDHSVSQLAVVLGEIRRDQIPGHCERSRLLRVLGDEDMCPEIHPPIVLEKGRHAFLLCTDGFWESVTEEEMALDLYKSGTAEEWICSLRQRLLRRMEEKHDNHTAIGIFAVR